MENRINIGVLGCAAIARRSLIHAIKKLPEQFHLAGIASRDVAKAAEWAKDFDTHPFSYQSVLDEPSIHAIYIPLPNSMHAEWIDKALDKGKHVMVEKSLATNLADAEHLNNKARSNKLVLLENFQFRFHAQLAEIHKIIADGTIGELRCVRSSFGFPPFPDPGNIRYQKELGGGALLDAGAYPIKVSQLFLGNDLIVKAAALKYNTSNEVDIWGGGFLKQANGPLFSEIAFGFDHFYQCNVTLWGSKGKLTATRIFTAPPGFEATLILETGAGVQNIKIPADDHFSNVLLHFHTLINDPSLANDEYLQNINQARLIEEFKIRSNE